MQWGSYVALVGKWVYVEAWSMPFSRQYDCFSSIQHFCTITSCESTSFSPSSTKSILHTASICPKQQSGIYTCIENISWLVESFIKVLYLPCNGSPSLQLQPSCQGCSHNSQVSHLGLYKGKTIGILVQCLSHQLSSWADALSSCHWWSFLYFAVEEIPVRKNDRHLYKEF